MYSFEENRYVLDRHETTDSAFYPVKVANVLFENIKRMDSRVTGLESRKVLRDLEIIILPDHRLIKGLLTGMS